LCYRKLAPGVTVTTVRMSSFRNKGCPGCGEKGVWAYVRAALERLGYPLLEAADGAEALEVARKHPGEIAYCSQTSSCRR